ncbi:hypothetical protein CQW23_22033 [Capsicum baccatum]|uniref:TF-B3 domain-containing protein n=1 Tax=Capsicum baccatum TaxID=33114 RepID=A0A2G2VZP7_CAPBA|nr:hypothetical protein CQW23_22033 [Capsicum baccatum]
MRQVVVRVVKISIENLNGFADVFLLSKTLIRLSLDRVDSIPPLCIQGNSVEESSSLIPFRNNFVLESGNVIFEVVFLQEWLVENVREVRIGAPNSFQSKRFSMIRRMFGQTDQRGQWLEWLLEFHIFQESRSTKMAAEQGLGEVVICKTLMEGDVNSWGKGLKVVKDELDNTNAPGRSLNPVLAVPATLRVEDELNKVWEMDLVERNEGMYISRGWYIFVIEKGLQVGDTIKIYRKLPVIPIINADYNIRIERNEASSTDSNEVS